MCEGCKKNRQYEFDKCECPSGKMTRFIEPCLLFFLSRGSSYGYELIKKLEKFDFQRSRPDSAKVYRILRSLEKQECVVSKWDNKGSGPAKRIYELTPKGLSLLHAWAEGIEQREKALKKFLRLYKNQLKGKE